MKVKRSSVKPKFKVKGSVNFKQKVQLKAEQKVKLKAEQKVKLKAELKGKLRQLLKSYNRFKVLKIFLLTDGKEDAENILKNITESRTYTGVF